MDDIERFEQLINAGYCCISIVSHEEKFALEIIQKAALGQKRGMWIWSVAGGVREGLLSDSPFIADTESPAAGLRHLADTREGAICVTLDLAEHLKAGLTLRALRDIIDCFGKNGNTLVMIDSTDKLPEVIKSYAKPFEISLPDRNELKDIVRRTLRHFHRKTPIEIGITQKGLETIVRNLRGLTRRQAERIIIDTVADDRRFDDNDINRVI